MALLTLADWLSHLETQHVKAIDMGLERVQKVAHVLALQQLGCPVITVAGTNGKGSTVATLLFIPPQVIVLGLILHRISPILMSVSRCKISL